VEELNPEKLLEMGKKAVEKAVKYGANEAEAFLSEGFESSVEIERGQIVGAMSRKEHGLGLRAVYNNAIGFAYTTILDEKSITETIERAVKFAKANKPDENWPGFPSSKEFPSVENIYDKRITEMSPQELISNASLMLETATAYDRRVLPIGGTVQASYICQAIVNSSGVEAWDMGTGIGCYLVTIAREGSEVTPVCFEYNAERIFKVDPEWVGKEAAKIAVSLLKARKIESGKYTLILNEVALASLLYYTLISAIKADAVQREQSALKGKIGQKVASETLTIQDDGRLEGGLNSSKFDGEGVPTQRTLLIEKGVLKNFLYDSYTAKKDGVESTGNSYRGGLTAYRTTPTLEATNFVISTGNSSKEQLIEEVEDGLLVFGVQGAHSSNPATGEFSVVATPAWKVEKGEIAYPVKGAMLAGSIYEALENVSVLGREPRKIERLVSPWIRIENIRVVG